MTILAEVVKNPKNFDEVLAETGREVEWNGGEMPKEFKERGTIWYNKGVWEKKKEEYAKRGYFRPTLNWFVQWDSKNKKVVPAFF